MALTICIDSGHYGKYNRSPANKTYYESEVMWKLHLLQKKYLEQYGFEVITTRSNLATDLALHTRGTKSKGCVLFISDHSNATGSGVNESVDYVAVYCLTDDTTTKCDDISEEIANKLAPVIADVMGTKQGFKVLTRKAGNDRNHDGIMNDNYYGVLHGARTVGTPALILEHSFHTNSRSTNWLLDDSNLDKLAKAEAAAIAEHFGMKAGDVPANTDSKPADDSVLYRVQSGAFKVKPYAEARLAEIKKAGFEAFIVFVDGLYKVQTGAFKNKSGAEVRLAEVKKAGFDAFITTEGGQAVSASTPKKSVTEIAKEVIAGKWGNGADRKKKLEAAGYDYDAVQKKVNALLK